MRVVFILSLFAAGAPALAQERRYDLWIGCRRAGEAVLAVDGRRWTWHSTIGPVRARAAAEVDGAWSLVRAHGERAGPAGTRSSTARPGWLVRRGEEGPAKLPLDPDALPALAFEAWLAEVGHGCRAVVDEQSGAVGRACGRVESRHPDGGATLAGSKLGLEFRAQFDRAGLPTWYGLPALEAVYQPSGAPAPRPCRGGGLRRRILGDSGDISVPPLAPPPFHAFPPAERARLASLARDAARDDAPCLVVARRFAAAARALGYSARLRIGEVEHRGHRSFHAWTELHAGDLWVAVDPALDELPARSPRRALGPPITSPEAELAAGTALGMETEAVRGTRP